MVLAFGRDLQERQAFGVPGALHTDYTWRSRVVRVAWCGPLASLLVVRLILLTTSGCQETTQEILRGTERTS